MTLPVARMTGSQRFGELRRRVGGIGETMLARSCDGWSRTASCSASRTRW